MPRIVAPRMNQEFSLTIQIFSSPMRILPLNLVPLIKQKLPLIDQLLPSSLRAPEFSRFSHSANDPPAVREALPAIRSDQGTRVFSSSINIDWNVDRYFRSGVVNLRAWPATVCVARTRGTVMADLAKHRNCKSSIYSANCLRYVAGIWPTENVAETTACCSSANVSRSHDTEARRGRLR
jgi:hypothetical protein